VQTADSAHKHGVPDEDILHALRNPLASSLAPVGTSSSLPIAPVVCLKSSSWTTIRRKIRW